MAPTALCSAGFLAGADILWYIGGLYDVVGGIFSTSGRNDSFLCGSCDVKVPQQELSKLY